MSKQTESLFPWKLTASKYVSDVKRHQPDVPINPINHRGIRPQAIKFAGTKNWSGPEAQAFGTFITLARIFNHFVN